MTTARDFWVGSPIPDWRDTVTGTRVPPESIGAEPTGGFVVPVTKYRAQRQPVLVEIPRSETRTQYVLPRDDRDLIDRIAAEGAAKWKRRETEIKRERKRKEKAKGRKSRAKEHKLRKGGRRRAQTFPGIPETFRNAEDAAAIMMGSNAEFFENVGDVVNIAREWLAKNRSKKAAKRVEERERVGYQEAIREAVEAFFAPYRSRRWDAVDWWEWDDFVGELGEESARYETYGEHEGEPWGVANWYPPAYWAYNLGKLSLSELQEAQIIAEATGNDVEAIQYGIDTFTIDAMASDAHKIEQALQGGKVPDQIVPLAQRRLDVIEKILDTWPRKPLPAGVCYEPESAYSYCSVRPLDEFAEAMERGCRNLERCISPAADVVEGEEPPPEPTPYEPSAEELTEIQELFSNPPERIFAPAAARKLAAQALEIRKALPKSKRAGLSKSEARAAGITSGVQQAKRIAEGKKVDPGQVAKFFARFRGTYETAKKAGKTAEQDGGIMLAWDLWGGEPMRRAVQTRMRKRNPDGPFPPQNVPAKGRELMERVYQRYRSQGWSEAAAASGAWGALKRAGYEKRGSRWVKAEQGGAGRARAETPPAPRRKNPGKSPPGLREIKADRYVAGLGGLVEIRIETPERGELLYTWSKPYPLLWWSPELRVLAAVDGGKYSRPRALAGDVPAKVLRVREDFQGEEADRGRDVTIPDGKLHKVGRVLSLVYESNKKNGGGDGRVRLFEHDHAASDVMWQQRKSGPALLVVNGSRLTVTERGIVY